MRSEVTDSTHVKPVAAQANVGEKSFRVLFCRCPDRRMIRSIDESHYGLAIQKGSTPLGENVKDEYGGPRVGAIGGDRLGDAAGFSGWIDVPLRNGSTNQPTCEEESGAKMLRGAVRHHTMRHNEVPCEQFGTGPAAGQSQVTTG